MGKLLIISALAAGLSLPTTVFADPWTYVGGSGQTVELEAAPKRIIASQDAAAGLIPLGIRPVGIYVDSPVEDAKALEGLDLSGIEIIGRAWGEVDVEKAALLEPDLVIAEWWPLNSTWSGGQDVSRALASLAPVTGPTQGSSILTLIEDYEALAMSLGADLSAEHVAADKAQFERSVAAFKDAVAAKPDLSVLAVWPGTDALYVAVPASAAELMDFESWGLDVLQPEFADRLASWETLSWERADKYQPDLILVDNRSRDTLQTAEAQPTWTMIKAAAAGAVTDWPAFWLRNYAAYSRELDKLTSAVQAADEHLAD